MAANTDGAEKPAGPRWSTTLTALLSQIDSTPRGEPDPSEPTVVATDPGLRRSASARLLVPRLLLLGLVAIPVLSQVVPAAAFNPMLGMTQILGAAAIALGIRRHRPSPARPWWLLAAALIFFGVVPPLTALGFGAGADAAPNLHSAIDAVLLIGFVPFIIALCLFIRARRPVGTWTGILDALVIGASLAIPTFELLVGPALQGAGIGAPTKVVALSFPTLALVVLMGTFHLVSMPGKTPRSAWWLSGALGATLTSAIANSVESLRHVGAVPSWVSLGWLICPFAFGLAALDPSMAELTRPVHQQLRRLGHLRPGAVALALFSVPATAVLEVVTGGRLDGPLFAAVTALFALVVVRSFRAEAKVAEIGGRERYLSSIVGHLSDVIWVIMPGGRISYQSATVRGVLGYETEAAKEGLALDSVHPEDRIIIARLIKGGTIWTGRPESAEIRIRHADGRWLWFEVTLTNLVDDPLVGGVVVVAHEITERRAFQQQLEHRALHDELTGLPNRALLVDRLRNGLARAERRGERVQLLFIDLDDFKGVNDTLGHVVGDELLTRVANRLRQSVRTADTVARLGGDEFAVLLEDAQPVELVVERIRSALAAPIDLEGHQVAVSASIGIATGGGETSAMDLLRNADLAMYQAKAAGKDRAQAFIPEMYEEARSRNALLGDLRLALQREELRVYYQPSVRLDTGEPVGVEALLRWQHPTLGLLAPTLFIPLAEQSGLIVPIGRWVLMDACKTVAGWDARLGQNLSVAVNLSMRQLESEGILDDVQRALEASGLDPGRLTLEVTESQLMREVEVTAARLTRLKSLGVRIAVDDFGTGYSSLAYLRQFPIDLLKIDRAFVTPMGNDPDAQALVRAVIEIARTLQFDTLAEGVENEDQARALVGEGCHLAQGFLFARPLPAAEVLRFIAGAEAA